MFKKLGIGLSVFVVFILYSLAIRHQNPVIAKPSSLNTPSTGNNNNSNSSTTTASTNTTSQASSSTTSGSSSSSVTTATYKDGTFNGTTQNAYWGNVQVAAVISGGKLTDVKVLQYPNTHSTSVYINQQALPYLKQEAVQAQSANIQIISGATYTSQAYIQSLTDALTAAHS